MTTPTESAPTGARSRRPATSVRRRRGGVRPLLGGALTIASLLVACHGAAPSPAEEADASWSVTAWGETYEVFPEIDPLSAGEVAVAHTHVTVLEGFAPLERGRVEIVLSGDGGEQSFRATEPVRPGIFSIEIRSEQSGDFDLRFRIASEAGDEEIAGGRVRVGAAGTPGRLLVAPAPRGALDGGEPLPFLKEEQWKSEFATAWVRSSHFARAVEGTARLRPPAGGDATLTAPVAAVLRGERWPYPGQEVDKGAILFGLVPRVAVDRSLAELEAELATVEAELAAGRSRLARLEELFALEAASLRELEEARTRVESLAARSSAAGHDLQTARSVRVGEAGETVALRAPFGGAVAEVLISPGETVDAGRALARVVRTDRVWIDVQLAVEEARQLRESALDGVVLSFGEGAPVRFEQDVRLVAIAPTVDPSTGLITASVEAPGEGLVHGAIADVRLMLDERIEGIVVPGTALIDDGGVDVVYLQLSGERFARQEVSVLAREGDRAMVENLTPGQRLVTRGGESIRRSSLLASGEAHGHVH
ncbi:MAG TPA: efflux RND transporter periplasmic adaptor subunit [Thermoanaerobaculia bacterium]|nr:efflux RND transporter periplasmic adaptor subunit [Thermoanaerobaculia bacterium]